MGARTCVCAGAGATIWDGTKAATCGCTRAGVRCARAGAWCAFSGAAAVSFGGAGTVACESPARPDATGVRVRGWRGSCDEYELVLGDALSGAGWVSARCAIAVDVKPMLSVPAPTASVRLNESLVRLGVMAHASAPDRSES